MIIEKIKGLIADQLGISADEITEGSDLIKDLKADSLDIVQMLLTLEEEFGMEFEDEQLTGLKTVGDVARFIDNNKS